MNEMNNTILEFMKARGNTVEQLENSKNAFLVTRENRPWYVISPVKCGYTLFTEIKSDGLSSDIKAQLLHLTCALTQRAEISRWSVVENETINGRAFIPGPFDSVASEPFFKMWENDLDMLTESLSHIFKPELQHSNINE